MIFFGMESDKLMILAITTITDLFIFVVQGSAAFVSAVMRVPNTLPFDDVKLFAAVIHFFFQPLERAQPSFVICQISLLLKCTRTGFLVRNLLSLLMLQLAEVV